MDVWKPCIYFKGRVLDPNTALTNNVLYKGLSSALASYNKDQHLIHISHPFQNLKTHLAGLFWYTVKLPMNAPFQDRTLEFCCHTSLRGAFIKGFTVSDE